MASPSMNTNWPGNTTRSMRHHVLSCGAVIALLWSLIVPLQATETREVEKIEAWSVFYDAAGEGACYAKGTYGKETSFTLGKIAPAATWFAVVSNPAFGPIQIGTSYEIRYVFGSKYAWAETPIGTQDGLRSDDIGDEFVDDFARASSMKLLFQGRSIDSFKLPGTRAAVAAINQCYVSHARKTAPYAASEPSEPQ
ncbi:MAG: hypothetical protein U1E67_01020 [Hyphomicrobiales bacterium]